MAVLSYLSALALGPGLERFLFGRPSVWHNHLKYFCGSFRSTSAVPHKHLQEVLADLIADDVRKDLQGRREKAAQIPPDLLVQHLASTFIGTPPQTRTSRPRRHRPQIRFTKFPILYALLVLSFGIARRDWAPQHYGYHKKDTVVDHQSGWSQVESCTDAVGWHSSELEKQVAAAQVPPAVTPSPHRVKRVLLLSLDGLHALGLANYVKAGPNSGLAQLSQHGITYTNARTSLSSNSWPGLLAMVPGGSPVSTGVIFENSYDRSLFPPGSKCTSVGTTVVVQFFLRPRSTLGCCNWLSVDWLFPCKDRCSPQKSKL